MKRLFSYLFICLSLFSFTACTGEEKEVEMPLETATIAVSETPTTSETPKPSETPAPVVIGISREVSVTDWNNGKLDELPTIAPDMVNTSWQVDIRSADLSHLDLSEYSFELMSAEFDEYTLWPESLPEGFEPDKFIEIGKNPGLGLRAIHEEGITGKGVSIGIIDQPLYTNHPEFKDNLVHYEEIGYDEEPTARMHGSAVSSISVGKTCGVAPEANLYFIAANNHAPNDTATYKYYAQAIHRFIEINETLQEDEKIKIISISWGLISEYAYYKEMVYAILCAKSAGIFVSTASDGERQGYDLYGANRPAICDPDDPDVYSMGRFLTRGVVMYRKDAVFVPMDSRAYASWLGDGYEYSSLGGLSWSVPYSAGLFVLCQQVYPDIDMKLYWEKLLETSDIITACTPNINLANPSRLIEAFRNIE